MFNMIDFGGYDEIVLDDITKILDSDFLYKNKSLKRESGKVIFKNNLVNEWSCYDPNTIEIESFYFDEVISLFYGGIDYIFRLNGKYIHIFEFAPTIQLLKNKVIVDYNRKIDCIKRHYFNDRLELLENIKRIENYEINHIKRT